MQVAIEYNNKLKLPTSISYRAGVTRVRGGVFDFIGVCTLGKLEPR